MTQTIFFPICRCLQQWLEIVNSIVYLDSIQIYSSILYSLTVVVHHVVYRCIC